MYDHEYEWQILGFLRMLKYVWQRNKDILADLRDFCRCAEIDVNDIFELSLCFLWSTFAWTICLKTIQTISTGRSIPVTF